MSRSWVFFRRRAVAVAISVLMLLLASTAAEASDDRGPGWCPLHVTSSTALDSGPAVWGYDVPSTALSRTTVRTCGQGIQLIQADSSDVECAYDLRLHLYAVNARPVIVDTNQVYNTPGVQGLVGRASVRS